MSSFTREHYLEVFKNAAELYAMITRGELTGPHRHKMKAKAIAGSIMDRCEDVIGQLPNRPDRVKMHINDPALIADLERLSEKFKVRR